MADTKVIEVTKFISGVKVTINANLIGYFHAMKDQRGEYTWLQVVGRGSLEVSETPAQIVAKMEHF